MRVPLLAVPERRWSCPNCDHTHATRQVGPHSVMHPCAGLAGLSTPMVPAGQRCDVRAAVREDYVGGDDVTYDGDGRPIMNVTVERDDGEDLFVYAPTAHMRAGSSSP